MRCQGFFTQSKSSDALLPDSFLTCRFINAAVTLLLIPFQENTQQL